MLSNEANELITRVGPGTPMGEYFRRFWIPALASAELVDPDGPPLRIRLLGEDLIAFRATSGKVGLIQNACPHRGASLFFGRNEEEGLRCVYHGWKFDVAGDCVDMPSEPAESNFKTKVHARAYPTIERGNLIWTYMGPAEEQPELPDYEWTRVPNPNVRTSRRLQECNYLQAIEGGIDSSHVPFLHGVLDPENRAAPNQKYLYRDTAPRLKVLKTNYGFAYGAQRNGDADSYYWRLTPFMLPFFTVIPGFTLSPDQSNHDAHQLTYSGHGWVPRDDNSCWMVTYSWNASRALQTGEGHPAHYVELDSRTLRANVNSENDYGIDRDVQRRETYTGIANGSIQDAAVQESMGGIYDRTQEHLGTSDAAIIYLRRMYSDAAQDIIAGRKLDLPTDQAAFRVRSVSAVLDRDIPFEEGLKYMDIPAPQSEVAAT
jgi:phenylpropionate dioxygenase-like ring-hydroxylating dioxygenase large terminal subunit